MKYLKNTLLLLFVAYPLLSIAQPILLTDAYVDYTRIANIDKNMGKIGMKSKTSIKSRWRGFDDVTNNLSMVASSGKLVKWSNQGIKEITLPYSGRGAFDFKFSEQASKLVYWDIIDDFNAVLNVYDPIRESLKTSHSFAKYLIRKGMSNNASTIALKFGRTTYLYSGDDNGYMESSIEPYISGFFAISNLGERVFYSYRNNDKLCIAYVEKDGTNWSRENLTPFYYGTVEQDNYRLNPLAIANEGKTILGLMFTNQLSLVHEKEGQWSAPEFIDTWDGNITPLNPIDCSEDGRVIALLQPKYFSYEIGHAITYDLFVLIKNQFGEWSKHQINLPEVHVEPGIKLTRDGSKLLWVPSLIYSSTEALEMK